MTDVFRRHEVFGDLYTAVQILHLVWRTCRNEHAVTQALDDCVSFNAVLLVEPIAEILVQVPALIMDGVVMRLRRLAFLDSYLLEDD